MSYTSSYLKSKYWCNSFLITALISFTEFLVGSPVPRHWRVSETLPLSPNKHVCRTGNTQAWVKDTSLCPTLQRRSR